jgi:LacI family transcriptional regulator
MTKSKKKLSIVDIASQLNVSKTTVSFVLNGRAKEKRISNELIERILKFVEEVGYKPNSLAKSLRTGKSHTIGLMVEDISNPFFANIARLIEDKAYNNGYKIIYSSTDNDTNKTKELLTMFSDRHVDGYIISPPEGIEENISGLLNNNLPVIFFDRYLPNIETDCVVVNNQFSTYNATKHLIDQGYLNIAFITFSSDQTQMQDRVSGYQKAIKENKLKQHLKEIKFNQNAELITRPITEYLTKNISLDAIVFGTNHMGACGLKVIKKLGLKIPDDLAIVSFDDYEVFQLYTPSITAIEQPFEEIADNVITLMLKRLKGKLKPAEKQNITIQTSLVIRESSIKAINN